MRYLIVSDIHSNWEALEAVLESARGSYDSALCCGDLVGYGADPNPVVDWVRCSVEAVVRGNHDKACAGLEDLEWFNPAARSAALWTARELTAPNMRFLRELPKGPLPINLSFQLVHGSPLDEDDYLLSTAAAAQAGGYMDRDISFFGHTHQQGGFMLHRNGVKRLDRPHREEPELEVRLERDSAYLVNPGSVGQPRDGDSRAAYAIYDASIRLVTYRRVEYDIAAAQRKIRRAGLPDHLANRLACGC